MFELTMLPAREGDCLILTYGEQTSPRRILVDGGRTKTYLDLKALLSQLPEDQRTFELVVITHVDRDHIEGILAMIQDRERTLQFRDLWFNGYHHLFDDELENFGPAQGERLSRALIDQQLPWNRAFGGRSVEVRPVQSTVELAGGLKITILSPSRAKLEALIDKWEYDCAQAGIMCDDTVRDLSEVVEGEEAFGSFSIRDAATEPFLGDSSKPNGSSIALLIEYDNKRVLLAGDSHPDILIESIRPLAQRNGGKLALDAFKVSHHGSQANTSKELLELVSCPRYLVSTNGSIFKHPDRNALARILSFDTQQKELIFNYKTSQTKFWLNPVWQERFHYQPRYPECQSDGFITIAL